MLFCEFLQAKSSHFNGNPRDRARYSCEFAPLTNRKLLLFESDFCVICASYMVTVLIIDNKPFCQQNLTNVSPPLNETPGTQLPTLVYVGSARKCFRYRCDEQNNLKQKYESLYDQ